MRSPIPPCKPTHRQHGAALLIFMLVFFLASMSWLLSQTSSSRMRSEADKVTSAALAQAKEALIGRAAGDTSGTPFLPGSLPCPNIDPNKDGVAANGCGKGAIGRLPWKTLDLPDLRDGNGDRLWYALADNLRDKALPAAINPHVSLNLSVDGKADVAAIVFSPGPPLAGQNGRSSASLNVSDYLDASNATGGPYISSPSSATLNDKLVTISRDQLFRLVNLRVLGEMSAGLRNYYAANANRYPAPVADLKSVLIVPYLDSDTVLMLNDNDWFLLTQYEVTADRQQAKLTIMATLGTSCTITQAKTLCTHP